MQPTNFSSTFNFKNVETVHILPEREIIAGKHIPDVRLFFEYRERERHTEREPKERQKLTERGTEAERARER